MTSYRYNCVGDTMTCSVVEGETVELPKAVGDKIGAITDPTWPETHWMPRGMTSFEYMNRIGPNHDGSSLGLIGADFLTFNAMLRIPVDMHNVPRRTSSARRCGTASAATTSAPAPTSARCTSKRPPRSPGRSGRAATDGTAPRPIRGAVLCFW